MLSKQLKEELQFIVTEDIPLSEMPVAMECGRKCNEMLPMHGGKDLTSAKGSMVGALVGGPFGMMYGGQRPLTSIHGLCRAKCRLSKAMESGDREAINKAKSKLAEKLQKSKSFSTKVKNAKALQSLINRVMSSKF